MEWKREKNKKRQRARTRIEKGFLLRKAMARFQEKMVSC